MSDTTVDEAVTTLDGDDARRFHHMPGLDGVRGVAVVLVVLFHYGSLWAHGADGGLLPGGFIGVDLFFVLSGFLITSLLVGERAKVGKVSFGKFYARRGLRLMPALVAFVILNAIYIHQYEHLTWAYVIKLSGSAVFYVSNLAQTYFLKSMIHTSLGFTWSLAVEEQFYFIWPALLLFGVLRFCKTRTSVLTVLGGGAALSALIRIYEWNWGAHYPASYMRLDTRADGLLIGAACAFLWRWRMVPLRWLNQAATVSAIGIIVVSLLWHRLSGGMFQGGFTLVSIAAATIILAVAEGKWSLGAAMDWAPLRMIGRVAYGLYIWHELSLRASARILSGHGRFNVALGGLVLCAIVVPLSWFLIEKPFLRLKDRMFASPVRH